MAADDDPDATLRLSAAIEAIYAAPFTPGGWQHAIGLLSDIFPSVGLALYGHDELAHGSVGVIQIGFDPEAIESFLAHYSGVNAWAPGFLRSPVGALLNSDQFLPREELFRSEYYNDWLKPQGNQVVGWGGLLVNDGTRYLAFSSTLRARDEETLSEPVRRMIERVMPHLERAFRISRIVTGADVGPGVQSVMESLGEAAFALDAQGRVHYANARARALPAALLHLGRDARLAFADANADRALEASLFAVADPACDAAGGSFVARGPEGARASCMLTPFRMPGNVDRSLAWFLEGPVGILVVRPEGHDPAILLRRSFGLSTAETEVAMALAAGRAPREIAEDRGTSILTVRNQIRRVFEKLDVRRQSEVSARLAALAGSMVLHSQP